MIAGEALGILDVMFMLALIGFSLWKGGWIRIILSICIIVWGAFALSYDVKIAAPLLAVGAVLFAQTIFVQIQQAREAATTE
ncbi:MAG: hypothetical protein KAT35_01590 [Candidatus Aenigmarchaeota archaeon]|nr:hypothetical protein [Candidatus Aenigmarchaeota archaeon]